MSIILFAAVLLLVFLALWWLLVDTEGVYLGRRVVIGLYDIYAKRYDRIKQFDEVTEHLYLAQPIMNALQPRTDPLVLDVATGTGRLPLALCQHARFEGHIIALDLSLRMLEVAAAKLQCEHFDDYVTLLWATSEILPFHDMSFDLVTCLEALEFMPNPQATLKELARVLYPGGLFLTTLRQDVFMPGRRWTHSYMTHSLSSAGIIDIRTTEFTTDYQLVWGRKAGNPGFQGIRPIEELIDEAILKSLQVDNNALPPKSGIIDLYSSQKKLMRLR